MTEPTFPNWCETWIQRPEKHAHEFPAKEYTLLEFRTSSSLVLLINSAIEKSLNCKI